MIKIDVTPMQLARANERFKFGSLKGSITDGAGNLSGALGEIVVLDFMKDRGNDVLDTSTYDYDIIVNNKKIDVKSKRLSVPPQPHYRCAVSAYNTRQKCDYYVFTHVIYDMSSVYISGFINKSDFYEQSTFYKKGESDPLGSKEVDFVFTSDCYVMNISDLNQF